MANNEERMTKVLSALVKPLAKFCLRYSVSLQVLIEQMKVALVEAAAEELEKNSKKVNVSRLSVRTGLHRKDVTRIYKNGGEKEFDLDIVRKIIGHWSGSKRYTDKKGLPLKLHYKDESSINFHALVYSQSKDTDAKAVLVCLESLNIVKHDGERVELLTDAYIVKEDEAQGYQLLARDVSNLTQAVEENIHGDTPVPNLHARTKYDNLLKDKLPEMREWILKRGTSYHHEVRDYLMQYDKDLHPELEGEGGGAVTFGTYSLTEDEERSD